ncbi:shufflon system plasmid conjugative transfer pilus tip adhesin PilV, partial [Phytobacter sp. V91]|uniref:shufflon system plasmid conjugative transfer pilus tip adhesin PilV n=1 Tax=Phytobacter sp. V91 TaxID=3369425 RepID=UPI003F6166AD
NTQAKIAGEQIRQLGEAVNSYISIRYDKLSTLTASTGTGTDPGPRTCTGSVCTITYQTLINEGLLPSSFTGVNINKSAYTILLKRNGTAPNYVINGLITTNAAWTSGNRVRYDLLGKAMHTAGVDSGMSKLTNQISGYSGLWSETTSGFSSINKVGLLGYRVGYDSSMYSVYLRRDGTLPMTGDLNMGGNDINNVKDITASGDISAVSFNGSYGRFAKNVNVSEDLYVAGFSSFAKNVNMSSYLTVKSGINSESYVSAKTNSSRLQIGGGGSSNQNAVLLNVSGGSGDGYLSLTGNNNSSVKLDIWGSQKIRGDLMISASNDGKTTGAVSATGNISSSGTVSGQYLKPVSISVEGTACTSNGLISKISDGSLLSCINGIWRSPVSLQTMTFMLGGDHKNYGDICQRHLNNNGLSTNGWVITGSDVCTEDEHYCTIDNVKCYAIKLK